MACIAASIESRGMTGLSMNKSYMRKKQVLTSASPCWGAAGQLSLPLKLMGSQGTHKRDTWCRPGLKLQKIPAYHQQEISKKNILNLFLKHKKMKGVVFVTF